MNRLLRHARNDNLLVSNDENKFFRIIPMVFRLFLLFTIIPVLELYLLIKIGGMIGALNTVLIILVTAIIGASLAKSQGLIVLSKIQQALNEGRIPGNELLHGLMILIGGVTLLTPGFITDLIGLSMMIPHIRDIYIKYAKRIMKKRIETGRWDITYFK